MYARELVCQHLSTLKLVVVVVETATFVTYFLNNFSSFERTYLACENSEYLGKRNIQFSKGQNQIIFGFLKTTGFGNGITRPTYKHCYQFVLH